MLSCKRCRSHKVKCDLARPCSSCVRVNVECVPIENDLRKRKSNATYVMKLEKQLESFKRMYHELDKMCLADEWLRFWGKNKETLHQLLIGNVDAPIQKTEKVGLPTNSNIRPVYGPTSVYDNENRPVKLETSPSDLGTVRELANDENVKHCLKLFFTWQYPDHNMYVFREAFLDDFFNGKSHSLYCLLTLVYSICALGARMLDDDAIYNSAKVYYERARTNLQADLELPSLTALQSFLLLAFYDINNGNNLTGWMLSGSAVRMGFDLGFQLNPELWFLKRQGTQGIDVAIRSRIYWGCYMADHFILLILGRPSSLKFSDALIPETEDLPELDWITEFKYTPENFTNISDPLKNMISLIEISDSMLTDIFTKTDQESHADDDDLNLLLRMSQLFEYNQRIMLWKQFLPADLNWDKRNLLESSDNPTVSGVRYFYYIVILCLNRPFVGFAGVQDSALLPKNVCSNAMEDLYIAIERFELTHGLRRASIFIVYCSILSISIILLTATSELLGAEKRAQLKYFMLVLKGCSRTWGLAERSYELIKRKLEHQFGPDSEFLPERKPKRAKREPSTPVTLQDLIEPEPTSEVYRLLSPPDAEQAEPALTLDTLDDQGIDFFGGPPVLMTSDLLYEDWESLFPNSILHQK